MRDKQRAMRLREKATLVRWKQAYAQSGEGMAPSCAIVSRAGRALQVGLLLNFDPLGDFPAAESAAEIFDLLDLGRAESTIIDA